jgi:hypothetical protein
MTDENEDAVVYCRPVQEATAAPAGLVKTAPDLLNAAAGHMRQRAVEYDRPGGERSMSQTVEAFNAITKGVMSESEGWLFMQILKDVRDRHSVNGHRDSLEDSIAYSALKAEARLAGR